MPIDKPDIGAIWVSADAMAGCSEAGIEAGFDVTPYLVRHSIDPEMVRSSRGLISFEAMSNCLETIAREESCPDFGFRLGKMQKPTQFGMISQIQQFAPNVETAINTFLKYRDLYSQSSHWELHRGSEIARLTRYDYTRSPGRRTQILVYSMTRGFMAIRSMIDRDWSPIGVYFAADEFDVSTAMRRFFGAPLFFNSMANEIAFSTSDLDRSIPSANPEMLAALTQYFDRLIAQTARHGPIAQQVIRQLKMRLGSAPCGLPMIAAALGMNIRTLQRCLAAEGTSHRSLLKQARIQAAEQLLENKRMLISEIAAITGYQHLSSFSRAYRNATHCNPTSQKKLRDVERSVWTCNGFVPIT